MNEPIISVSGLRGIVGQSLSPEVAVQYAAAFAQHAPPGSFVITRDGRGSGLMLVDAIRSALCAMGRNVFDADVAATPTTGVLVRHIRAAGGIQVSASHNPSQYNGMKLFSQTGRVIDAAAGEQVRRLYDAGQFSWANHANVGGVMQCEDTIADHLNLVLATVDVERIRSRTFRVLLDSNHGAGSLVGRHLLSQLNCEVIAVGEEPDGEFAHPAEPTAENLESIRTKVREADVTIGFCQDPDADRLAVIDENGNYLGEEYTLALCLDHVLKQRPGPIVTNCATSRMSQDVAAKYNVPFHVAPVGEANVVQVMLANEAVFGGEGNGGPIDPRVGYVRDSFVGMALILDAMAAQELPVSQLAAQLPRYEIHKTKVAVERDAIPAALASLEKHFHDARPNRMDGLRLDWDKRWLLVRASNTEPIVRIIAEAATLEEAQSLCQQAEAVLEGQRPV